MTCRTIHVIPRVSVFGTKCVHTVLSPKVVWLFLGPVTEFIRTPIHPGKKPFCCNVIQTNPRLFTIVSVLNIHVLFLTFNSG